MSDFLANYEPALRIFAFAGTFAAMVVWERMSPRRRSAIPRRLRWSGNLGLGVVDTLVIRLAFPLAATGFALVAEQRGWGALNALDAPLWLKVVLSLLVLDLLIYLQHVMLHAVPVLWRLHRVHHADQEFDVTTGLRFHPLEALLSMVIKLAAVAALGAPPLAVLLFEILLSATSLFNHSNVCLPPRLDRLLRWLVVTPDMHRVHHSARDEETNSNYGFNLSWWDALLGTYRALPRHGHEHMTIGLEQFRTRRDLRLDRLVLQPLVAAAGKPRSMKTRAPEQG